MSATRIVLFANTAWYLFNFRLDLANRLRDNGYEVILVAPDDIYINKLRLLGFSVEVLQMNRRGVNPWQEIKTIFSLRKILLDLNADIIFNFTIKCVIHGSIAALLSNVNARVNAVAGLGSIFTNTNIKFRILKPLIKSLFKLTMLGKQARLIVQNREDFNVFVANKIIDSEKISLIKGSGVSQQKFPMSGQTSSNNTVKILFASRLLWAKGISEYVEAARLLKESKHIQFLVAGDADPGNPDSVAQSDIERWDSGNVHFLGHVDSMHELISDSDIVVLPSNYGEGVPRILVEAAACGKPLIAYDIPGSREIIVDKENGVLIKEKNIPKLVEAILQLASSKYLRVQMGQRSHALFMSEFEEKNVNLQTIKVIESSMIDSVKKAIKV